MILLGILLYIDNCETSETCLFHIQFKQFRNLVADEYLCIREQGIRLFYCINRKEPL